MQIFLLINLSEMINNYLFAVFQFNILLIVVTVFKKSVLCFTQKYMALGSEASVLIHNEITCEFCSISSIKFCKFEKMKSYNITSKN